jgi:hypothetical protein
MGSRRQDGEARTLTVNLQMAQERFPDIKFLETREIY